MRLLLWRNTRRSDFSRNGSLTFKNSQNTQDMNIQKTHCQPTLTFESWRTVVGSFQRLIPSGSRLKMIAVLVINTIYWTWWLQQTTESAYITTHTSVKNITLNRQTLLCPHTPFVTSCCWGARNYVMTQKKEKTRYNRLFETNHRASKTLLSDIPAVWLKHIKVLVVSVHFKTHGCRRTLKELNPGFCSDVFWEARDTPRPVQCCDEYWRLLLASFVTSHELILYMNQLGDRALLKP